MPDKFDFAHPDAHTMVVIARGSRNKKPSKREVTSQDVDAKEALVSNAANSKAEEEIRAIAAHAMHVENTRTPTEAITVGPGLFVGPRRYLPPGKRIHLYWEYIG